jgi:tetratricopeptide (TPR) repeat protein
MADDVTAEDYASSKERNPKLQSHEQAVCTAQMMSAIGDWDAALKHYEKAWLDLVKLRENYVWQGQFCRVGVEYGTLLDNKGKLDEAEDVFNSVMEISPGPEVLGAYAVFLHRKRKNYDLAERYFQESLKQLPTQSSCHLKYAGFLRHVRKNFISAEHHYEKAVASNPRNIDALGTYASYLHGLGDAKGLEKAQDLYERCVKIDPCHPNNCCNYGLFLSEERGDYKRAEELYEAALHVSSEHANTLYNYGVMLDSHMGEKVRAEDMYRRALLSNSNHPFALYNLAVILEDKMLGIDKDDPKQADARVAIREEAGGMFARASAVSPNDATTLADHGRFLLTYYNDKVGEGERLLTEALKLDEFCATALHHLGVLAVEQKKLSHGESMFRRLRSAHPKHVAGLRALLLLLQDPRYVRKGALKGKDAVDELLLLYESVLVLTKTGENGDDVLNYTTLAEDKGDATQKLRAITFLERTSSGSTGATGQLELFLQKAQAEGGMSDDEEEEEAGARETADATVV